MILWITTAVIFARVFPGCPAQIMRQYEELRINRLRGRYVYTSTIPCYWSVIHGSRTSWAGGRQPQAWTQAQDGPFAMSHELLTISIRSIDHEIPR